MLSFFKRRGCECCTETRTANGHYKIVIPPKDMNGEDDNDLVVSRFHIDTPSKTLCYYGEDATGEGMDDYITIRFCPMCGKKL